MELITNKSPISHPHAKTFKYATKIDGGTMIDVLKVRTDLAFEGRLETGVPRTPLASRRDFCPTYREISN